MKNLKVIILMGPPGSGKGTQAELLSDRLSLYYLETSKVLEEKFKEARKGEYLKVKGKKYKILDEKKLWEKGILCHPPFVTHLVKEKIKELFKLGKNLVLAGSPRTLYEGREIIPLLKKLYGQKNLKIILLELTPRQSIWRNSHRRICQLMRHPILYTKETAKLKRCPLDGSKLIKRKGLDEPKTIKVRLKEYKERTFPLIEYFKAEGLNQKKINGGKSVEKVFKEILEALK
ncbi:MAG: nucleoside monophosphate kinase [Patescibacteria group bacterium]|nr:nucleoside monophosphate kinase [Patescibacteria group bacterium]